MAVEAHQTIRLARGKHAEPSEGVCVMELASMLAGEPFSDRPQCVCPVIAAFLRTYNDGVDDECRRDLFRFASAAVGTRSTGGVARARARAALAWARAAHGRTRRRALARLVPSLSVAVAGGPADAGIIAARVAVRLVADGSPGAHEAALALVDHLIEHGSRAAGLPLPATSGSVEPQPVLAGYER